MGFCNREQRIFFLSGEELVEQVREQAASSTDHSRSRAAPLPDFVSVDSVSADMVSAGMVSVVIAATNSRRRQNRQRANLHEIRCSALL